MAGLDAGGREKVRELIEASAVVEAKRADQADLVADLREAGVAWSAIGWAIGTSGEAARQRFGPD